MNEQLFDTIHGWAGHYNWLDILMVFAAEYLIFIIALVCFAIIGQAVYRKKYSQAAWMMAVLVVSFLLLKLASIMYISSQPFVQIGFTPLVEQDISNSFPSDHVAAVVAFAAAVLAFSRYRLIGVGLLLAALLVGLARIYVGVHWPVDVLASIAVVLIAVVLVDLTKYLTRRIEPDELDSVNNELQS